MPGLLQKAQQTIGTYRELVVERPAPTRIKRFLLAVNGWCNSRCTFCNIWQYDKAQALREEITLDELERHLFTSPALAGVLTVGLTGGEPFLRRDIAAVCRSLYNHLPQAQISIVTNGLRPERIAATAAEIVQTHPGRGLAVAVSLDGYGPTHDTVRGVPGNFERVMRTVSLLKAQAPTVALGLSHTISPATMGDSVRCYELSRELGIGFIYRLAHESPYLRNEGAPIWSAADLAGVRPIVDTLNERILADQSGLVALSNLNYASLSFYQRTMDYVTAPRRLFDCYSGTHSFYVAHTGDVHACINLPSTFGNIRQTPFDQVWFGDRADAERRPIAAWQCHCWTNCETELSLARSRSAFIQSVGANLRSRLPGQTAERPAQPDQATA